MKTKQLVLAIIVFLLVFACGAVWYPRQAVAPSGQPGNQVEEPVIVPDKSQAEVPIALYYPMTNYESRVLVRSFGQLVRPTDAVSPCGAPFSGYHVADDLEVTINELNEEVAVYAIADGTVRQVGAVSGYGGLLVLETTINGQKYTVYYGHIDLNSTDLRVGDSVGLGQRLALLGAQCSSQTGGERKHLHFAIHKGLIVDVRGYVPNPSTLDSWVNPKTFFIENSASNIQ